MCDGTDGTIVQTEPLIPRNNMLHPKSMTKQLGAENWGWATIQARGVE